MELWLLRHGETLENRERIIQGQLQGVLSEEGHRQAQLVGEKLRDEAFDLIYCSDLQRTKDTLQYIMPHHSSTPIHHTEQIREKSFGEFEGVAGAVYLQAVEDSGMSRVEFRPAGGESFLDLQERVWSFFQEMRTHHLGKRLLACTHGGVIRALLSSVTQRSIQEFILTPIKNTSITIIDGSDSSPKVVTMNDISHLPDSVDDTAV